MTRLHQILGSMPMPRAEGVSDPKDRIPSQRRKGLPPEDPSQMTFQGLRAAKTGMVPSQRVLDQMTWGDKKNLYETLVSKVRDFGPSDSKQLTFGLEALRRSVPNTTLADLTEADLDTLRVEEASDDLWSEWPQRRQRRWAPRIREESTRALQTFRGTVKKKLAGMASVLGEAVRAKRAGDGSAVSILAANSSEFNKTLSNSVMEAVKSGVSQKDINKLLGSLDKDGLSTFNDRIKHFRGKNRVSAIMANDDAGVRNLQMAVKEADEALGAFERGDFTRSVINQRLSGMSASVADLEMRKAKGEKVRGLRDLEGMRESLLVGRHNIQTIGQWTKPAEAGLSPDDVVRAAADVEDGVVRSFDDVAHDEDFYSVSTEIADRKQLLKEADQARLDELRGEYKATRGSTKFYEDLEDERREVAGSGDRKKVAELRRRLARGSGKLQSERKLMVKLLRDGAFRAGPGKLKVLTDLATRKLQAKQALPPAQEAMVRKALLMRAAAGFDDLTKSEAAVGAIMKKLGEGAPASFEGVVKNPRMMKLLKTLFRL